MFYEYFDAVGGFELTDESWIPEGSHVSVLTDIAFQLAYQSSLAIPRSLQHLINALLLQASVAVGIPEGSKYSCSPLAIPTSLEIAHRNFSISRIDQRILVGTCQGIQARILC